MYGALIGALARAVPDQLGHLDEKKILVIASAARRESIASIRPLTFGKHEPEGFIKPRVTVHGERMLYELALRPKFFIGMNARERLAIFAHELWHISPDFDGTLAEDRRHDALRLSIDRLER